MRQQLQKAGFFAVSLLFFLAAAEALSRAWLPNRYYVWPPDFRRTADPEPGALRACSARPG